MDLVLSDDQRMIREQARRLLADRASSEMVRRVVDTGSGVDGELWSSVAGELGWCAMALPEEHGGLGLGMTEVVLVAEAVGERLAPLPYWSTALAAVPLVLAVASDEAQVEWLPRIAGGAAATVAWGDLAANDPLAATSVEAQRFEEGYILSGVVSPVIDALCADILIVPAWLDGRLALFALEKSAGHDIRLLPTLDATRQWGELTLDRVTACARLDSDGFKPRDAEVAVAAAMLGLAAEQIGVARGALDSTLAYISTRIQFGRAIASFQAVKHRCAFLEVQVAEARALLYGAASDFSEKDRIDRDMECAAVVALATEVAYRAAEEAIQLHGGVGFTWEYDPHLYFKRAQASSTMFGAVDANLDLIAGSLLAHAGAQ